MFAVHFSCRIFLSFFFSNDKRFLPRRIDGCACFCAVLRSVFTPLKFALHAFGLAKVPHGDIFLFYRDCAFYLGGGRGLFPFGRSPYGGGHLEFNHVFFAGMFGGVDRI